MLRRVSHRFHRTHSHWLIGLLLLWQAERWAMANPKGGEAVHGQVEFQTNGNKLTIRQTDDRAILQWQDFSIAPNEITQFLQPGSNSATLNRVIGGKLSEIYGTLEANGKIYLINPNGIVVGPSGTINTAGFVGSTLDVSNEQFLAGGDLTFRGNSTAKVVNMGKIGATDSDVILIAQEVENLGTITAPNGTASLAAGQEVLVKATGAERVFVQAGKGSVTNKGLISGAAAEIKAAGGNEYALAINNTGTVRATGVFKQGGRILLRANTGTVRNSGTLSARPAAPGAGGPAATAKARVEVHGPKVELTETSHIEALGGGFVETSGLELQIAKGSFVDTRAEDGSLGTWLIDPVTLNIVTGGGSNPAANTLDPDSVVTMLNTANVTLQATSSITVSNGINASANANAGNLTFDTITLNLNAPVILKTGSTLSGTPLLTTVNVGAGGLVQNGIDAVNTGGTVNLAAATYNLPGTVTIGKNLTLNGTAGSTVLDANSGFRVMTVSAGTVTLNGLTLREGRSLSGGGLAISGGANVTFFNGTITANASTSTSGSGEFGGGILLSSGTLLFNQSTLSNNTARFGAAADNYGTLTFINSTISGNVASSNGGVYNNPGATLNVTNSTVANNTTPGFGGGLDNDGGTLTVTRSTIIGNSGSNGGGIYSGGGTLTLDHNLIAGNTAGNGANVRFASGTFSSLGYNLIGPNSGITLTGTDINYTGTLDTLVQTSGGTAVLTNNGGPTQTIALILGSAAYLTGGTNPGGLLDQRGLARGGTISIGAYDANPTALSHIVTTAADNLVLGSSQVSLRAAIYAVNNNLGSGTAITFDSAGVFATPQTITLSLGELNLARGMTITGSAAGVTIDANGQSRVLTISAAGGNTVTLDHLTLAGGRTTDAGGGIQLTTGATLNLSNSTVRNNTSTTSSGGGIYLYGSTLNITNSTVSGNTSFNYGGGIESVAGTALTILSSTFANNTSQYGGALDLDHTPTTITNTTIARNQVVGDANGAGIYNYISSVTLTNSIVAGNTGDSQGADVSNNYIDGGYNLIGNVGSAGGFTAPTTRAGTSANPLDPLLAPLGNYGGPTQTFALLPGSPALNTGSATGTDQRGLSRVGIADIGAVESQGFTYTATSGSGQQAELNSAFANPLVVTVTPNNPLEPVSGGVVTLVLPSSGASATGTLAQALNASGQASFSLTANTTLGSYNAAVQASPTTTFSLENTQIKLTVTVDSGLGKIYGNLDPALTYSLTSGTFLPGDSLAGALARAAGENGGLYNVSLGSLSAGGNYAITLVSGTGAFFISPRSITITPNSGQGKIYGNVDPTLTYSVGGLGLAFADTISGALARAAGENVGDYAITQGSLSASSNYSVSFTSGVTFGISPRSIVIDPDSGQGKIYGNIDPTLTYTVGGDGLAFSDTLSGALGRTAGENVGNYQINQGSLSGGGNYLITLVGSPEFFSISPRSITITPDSGQSKIYGNVDPTLTYTVGGEGLAFSDTLTGALTRAPGENVGNYAINQGTVAASANYNVTFSSSPVNFGITPRAITITPNSGQGKIYGNADPTLTYTLGGDGLAFSDTLSGALARAAGENVGNYAINQGTLAASSNYDVTFTSGVNFGITPRSITIAVNSGQGKIYGEIDPTLTYSVGGMGLVGSDTVTGALSRTPGENVALYTIGQGTVSAGANYSITYTSELFSITPRAITITPDSGQFKIAGQSDPIFTYTIGGMGLAFSDTLSGELSRDPGERAGRYAITQGTLSAGTNYSVTFTPDVEFTIKPRPVVPVFLPGSPAEDFAPVTLSTLDAQLIVGSLENLADILRRFELPQAVPVEQAFNYAPGKKPTGVLSAESSFTIGQ